MTCESCRVAEENPVTGLIDANCDECFCRAISWGMEAFESAKAGKVLPALEKAMKGRFGDAWREHLPRLKQWRDRISGAQKKEATA